ncbi:sensor histidine kinase [Pseudomonas sp. N040]|uniref:sensor histidine kinase n=1 Tax=Pseudomonas sp. N040 TaxID=2785325 RepID=UPI0018A24B98|nr:HAMP domain-containing sensor histidine kinase [Pseudomonas sp. N040]MBF7730248.1 HAMP domain-containing histidine kinase [Pseudomonas sp. N040]MBW7013890.1 HAMP domain-containing histidine kinase [Pseudomonas sp. N040]
MTSEVLTLSGEQGRRVLRLSHLYRLIIGAALVALTSSNFDLELLNLTSANLFRYGSWAYLINSLLFTIALRKPGHLLAVFSMALVDVLLLSWLLYAAGGITSGIGNLLIVSVAIANILLRGRVGLLIAAVAAIGLIYLTFYLSLSRPTASNQYLQAGLLGLLSFAVALFVQNLTNRLQQTESIAAQRAIDVANLEALNTRILQRMRTGILLLDPRLKLLLNNPSATRLLGAEGRPGSELAVWQPELHKRLRDWQQNPTLIPQSLHTKSGTSLQPNFVTLPHGNQLHTLVFLDDISRIAQQAQQLKLVSLGRLTAGIAHEIRNPLGAISHAAQLLLESESLTAGDQRLAQIIQDQSRRMNLVIENVLQLSRRRAAEPKLLDLSAWLHNYVLEFRSSAPAAQTIHLLADEPGLHSRMDPDQLHQVLTNLVQNGLRYSQLDNPAAQLWIKLFIDPQSELPVMEVHDDGPGVAPERLDNIFEPFYTTETKGTGLGLYISRELCESNQARLDYKPSEHGGSCFRITFAHPRKLSRT